VNKITERISIGNYLDASDFTELSRNGIRAILSLDGTAKDVDYSQTSIGEVKVVPLIDGPGNSPSGFQHAVSSLRRLSEKSHPVLVQCHAGRSRSAAVVACHLMWNCGYTLADAMNEISEKREVIITARLQEVFNFTH